VADPVVGLRQPECVNTHWRIVCESVPKGRSAEDQSIHSPALVEKRLPNAELASHKVRVCVHRLLFCFQDMEHCTDLERFIGAFDLSDLEICRNAALRWQGKEGKT
jgi:hypothetical protein